MEPLEYCRQKVAAEGSNLYYLLLFQAPENRPGLLALYSLEAELLEVLEGCSELHVAQHKLSFWVEELQRMLTDTPRHPVSQALRIHLNDRKILSKELCTQLLQGFTHRLQEPTLDTREQLQLQCHETAGVLGLAVSQWLDPDNPESAKALQTLATAIEIQRRLRFRVIAGQPLHTTVPGEELTRFSLANEQFVLGADEPQLLPLKLHLLESTRQSIHDAQQMIRPSPAAGLALAQARIALGESAKSKPWLKSGLTTQGLPSISPLRKFWIAWRSATAMRE